jgi:hypothetical protein
MTKSSISAMRSAGNPRFSRSRSCCERAYFFLYEVSSHSTSTHRRLPMPRPVSRTCRGKEARESLGRLRQFGRLIAPRIVRPNFMPARFGRDRDSSRKIRWIASP